MKTVQEQNDAGIILFISLVVAMMLVLIFLIGESHADVDLDAYADAIYISEGGERAVVPYGMFFKGCDWGHVDYCRKIVKNTVYNTLVKYRKDRCLDGEDDLECLERRYCPINDPKDVLGLNRYWIGNMRYYLWKPKGESHDTF